MSVIYKKNEDNFKLKYAPRRVMFALKSKEGGGLALSQAYAVCLFAEFGWGDLNVRQRMDVMKIRKRGTVPVVCQVCGETHGELKLLSLNPDYPLNDDLYLWSCNQCIQLHAHGKGPGLSVLQQRARKKRIKVILDRLWTEFPAATKKAECALQSILEAELYYAETCIVSAVVDIGPATR